MGPQTLGITEHTQRRDPMTALAESLDTAWTSPGYMEMTRRIKAMQLSALPGSVASAAAGKAMSASTSHLFSSLKMDDQVTNEPGTPDADGAGTENNSLDKHLRGSLVTSTTLIGTAQVTGGGTDSGSGAVDSQTTGRMDAGGPDAGGPDAAGADAERREKMRKMLSILEVLHRAFNGTLSSRLTLMTRGEIV